MKFIKLEERKKIKFVSKPSANAIIFLNSKILQIPEDKTTQRAYGILFASTDDGH